MNAKSHRHSGQRVATEYTIRPKATHLVFTQTLMVTFVAGERPGKITLTWTARPVLQVFDYRQSVFPLPQRQSDQRKRAPESPGLAPFWEKARRDNSGIVRKR